jgi:hypothetical protein
VDRRETDPRPRVPLALAVRGTVAGAASRIAACVLAPRAPVPAAAPRLSGRGVTRRLARLAARRFASRSLAHLPRLGGGRRARTHLVSAARAARLLDARRGGMRSLAPERRGARTLGTRSLRRLGLRTPSVPLAAGRTLEARCRGARPLAARALLGARRRSLGTRPLARRLRPLDARRRGSRALATRGPLGARWRTLALALRRPLGARRRRLRALSLGRRQLVALGAWQRGARALAAGGPFVIRHGRSHLLRPGTVGRLPLEASAGRSRVLTAALAQALRRVGLAL